ncbi:hypothetical protein RJD24_10710 [Bacillaceae bacterium IKA-2]|nr:hypothetical protein RJD24_10710 [Bacillaceae bacterium IKA-2]
MNKKSIKKGRVWVTHMTDNLQQPFAQDQSFQDIINGNKSLVIFVRHLG